MPASANVCTARVPRGTICWRLSRGGARAQFTLYENLRRLVERRRKVAKLRTWQHLLLGGLSGALQRKQFCPERSDTVFVVWCTWDHPLLDSLSGALKCHLPLATSYLRGLQVVSVKDSVSFVAAWQ